MRDPLIPNRDYSTFLEESFKDEYGPSEDFTRATVLVILRRKGLSKYRERWKTLLYSMTGRRDTPEPSDEVLEYCSNAFQALVNVFPRHSVPGNGGVKRHNFPSYNYVQRKILEAKDIYDFHNDFPIPRSHLKLHVLDDLFEGMARDVGLKFTRTCVIKRPKFKKKK